MTVRVFGFSVALEWEDVAFKGVSTPTPHQLQMAIILCKRKKVLNKLTKTFVICLLLLLHISLLSSGAAALCRFYTFVLFCFCFGSAGSVLFIPPFQSKSTWMCNKSKYEHRRSAWKPHVSLIILNTDLLIHCERSTLISPLSELHFFITLNQIWVCTVNNAYNPAQRLWSRLRPSVTVRPQHTDQDHRAWSSPSTLKNNGRCIIQYCGLMGCKSKVRKLIHKNMQNVAFRFSL